MMTEKVRELRDFPNAWNLDYFEFLVERVWKIYRTVRVIDFGCGSGYMAALMMPLLSAGSSYAGIDKNAKAIEKAKDIFEDSGWAVDFSECDLNDYLPEEKYDIAICHGVLNHIPNAGSVLEKMVNSVVAGGRVICIEANAIIMAAAGDYWHGEDKFTNMGLTQKWLDAELANGGDNGGAGCDRYIGIKIPAMMHDLGLKDIDIRVNEKCTMRFVNPKDITRPDKNEIRKNIAEYFLKIGLSDADADDYAEDSMKFHNFMSRQTSEVINIKTPAWVISYGTKMSK